MIEFKNITKAYGDNQVLNNVSFKINQGEFFLISGASGKGKSTILNIIGMLDKPSDGSFIINDNHNPSIEKADGRNLLKQQISYLFQNYGLVENESISHNLDIALKFKKLSKKQKKIEKENALKIVNLNKSLNDKVYSLSGGEQQRVAIAKVLLKDSDIILCDEPTGSLDIENRDQVIDLLVELNKLGKTIVIVSHDPVMSTYATNSYQL